MAGAGESLGTAKHNSWALVGASILQVAGCSPAVGPQRPAHRQQTGGSPDGPALGLRPRTVPARQRQKDFPVCGACEPLRPPKTELGRLSRVSTSGWQ